MSRFTRRALLRTYREAPINCRSRENDESFDATMCNSSTRGMQFVAARYLEPGSTIVIDAGPQDDPSPAPAADRWEAVVRWCRAAEEGGFRVGVQYEEAAGG